MGYAFYQPDKIYTKKEGCSMEKAKVYFTKELTPKQWSVCTGFWEAGLSGETAVKVVHSGEMGNQNFIRPDFMKKVIEAVNGTRCGMQYSL